MKHATATALDKLEPLLQRVRDLETLKEKSRGCFYLDGKGYLHFHEHGEDELYADIGTGAFDRLPAMTVAQRKLILERAVREIAAARTAKKR